MVPELKLTLPFRGRVRGHDEHVNPIADATDQPVISGMEQVMEMLDLPESEQWGLKWQCGEYNLDDGTVEVTVSVDPDVQDDAAAQKLLDAISSVIGKGSPQSIRERLGVPAPIIPDAAKRAYLNRKGNKDKTVAQRTVAPWHEDLGSG